jgi:putative glutamine amidotransferase
MSGTLEQRAPGSDGARPAPPRPLIGVTTSEVRPTVLAHPRPESDPARPEMALGMAYMRALEGSGALPVVIPPMESDAIEPLCERFHGICLSGGPDIDPIAYREQAHPKLGPTWEELDRLELELARRADATGVPLLGICRGAQTINVARGGTLYQHLPATEAAGVEHRQSAPGESVSHPVEIEPGTRLAGIVGTAPLEVNSFHHQAVHELGRDLIVSARSSDGVVEAIEATDHPFLIGVQWHAEFLVGREPEASLFAAFVEAARARGPAPRGAGA